MGKGGRFGKYGEQKRFERLKQKRKGTPQGKKTKVESWGRKNQGRFQGDK